MSEEPRKPTSSPVFDNADGKADIILRSVDNVDFALRRALLEASSSVFEDMLSLSQPARQDGSTDAGELDVVQLAEQSRPLELFLRHVKPQAYLRDELAPGFPPFENFAVIEDLEDVLGMARKYDAPLVLDVVARLHIPKLIRLYPLYGWVVACEFDRVELVREATRTFADAASYKPLAGAKRTDSKASRLTTDRRDFCLGDINSKYLAKLPTSSIRNFCAVHAKVVASSDGKYTWSNAADEFEL